ncbi:MAG: hypothetical protein GX465_05990 [Acidobacteria bacterium]|nr:hypothetical protein [Acidobacteriota bacterium]
MKLEWHHLPGPGLFADQIVADLRAGISIILIGTRTSPDGIARSIRATLSQEAYHWHIIDEGRKDPLTALFDYFKPTRKAGEIISILSLTSLPNFVSGIIELNIANKESWTEWVPFLEDYSYFCRDQDPLLRSQFIVMIPRTLSALLPREDILLRTYDAYTSYSMNDIRIYAMCLAERGKGSPLKKQLVAAIAAELSIWDRDLCERLCSASLSALIDPSRVLSDYGTSLGWKALSVAGEVRLLEEQGIVRPIGQSLEYHSGFLSIKGDHTTVQRRVWQGMVSVLFPLIEVRRQEFINAYRYLLEVPHQSPDGSYITNILDLDWGNICYQLNARRSFVHKDIYTSANTFREVRNALAHNELVPMDVIQSGVMERPVKSI